MKNTIKLFGLIALVAVIGFSMTACGGGGSNDDGNFTVNLTGFNEYAGKKINIRIGSSSAFFYFIREEESPVIDQSGKATLSNDFSYMWYEDYTNYFIIEIYASPYISTLYKSKEEQTIKISGGRLNLSINDFEPYDY